MNIKKQLENIKDYLDGTRQIGHTTALINGAKSLDSVIFLANDKNHASLLKSLAPNAIVKNKEECLRGYNKPLLIDNSTLREICNSALSEINRLETALKEETKKQSNLP